MYRVEYLCFRSWLSITSIILSIFVITSSVGESSTVKFEPAFEPGNALGIFTERIMLMQKWSGGTKILKEMNMKYIDEEGLLTMREICDKEMKFVSVSDEPGMDDVQFGNCSFTAETIAVYEWTGESAYKEYNYTTKEVRIQEFIPTYDDSIKCVLDNLMRPKFYAAITTSVFPRPDGKVSEPYHRLDAILEHQMSFFESFIDEELVYQFDAIDFLNSNSDPTYKCIVSIMTSAAIEELEKNCEITCLRKKDGKPVEYKKKVMRDEL